MARHCGILEIILIKGVFYENFNLKWFARKNGDTAIIEKLKKSQGEIIEYSSYYDN